MSDFIFSTKSLPTGKLNAMIASIYNEDVPNISEYHGNWGSLAVSKNMHFGFSPIETEEFICFIIGAPLVSFADKCNIKDCDSNFYTQEVFKRWKDKKQIKWDEDFSGPFVIGLLNKQLCRLDLITDLMSFIPVYEATYNEHLIVGTHVDSLARTLGRNQINDVVSIADFIMHGYVTYPYTLYKNIRQVSPASVHTWNFIKDSSYKSEYYWRPLEKKIDMTIKQTAKCLREGLADYTTKIASDMDHIALFISGGEDSRTVLSLLPREINKDAFIFLDNMNREGVIAKQVAERFDANFNMVKRPPNYYLDVLVECNNLVGSGSQSTHVHTYGFHKNCSFDKYSAIFGGLFSDALLKGSRIRKIKGHWRVPFMPQLKRRNDYHNEDLSSMYLDESILKELTERHRVHYKWIYSMRPKSADEWFELWPSSMNFNIPNLHGNRRLFRSYEPFMSSQVVKIAATVPQSWKLNRRLFHHMTKPLLKEIKEIPHSDGWVPYYPWYINSFIYGMKFSCRELTKKLGIRREYQGPWSDFQALMTSSKWKEMVLYYMDNARGSEIIKEVFSTEITNVFESEIIDPAQKRNLMQILILLGNVKEGGYYD